jgi:carbonic anhydrase
MKAYRQLLLANQAWAAELKEEQPEFFSRQVAGQQPEFLWIGCSDSRVSPEQMTMTPPGGMFLHRNVANLFHEDDLNLLSVLQYAISVLRVKHVIICGHYGCGGILAAMSGGTTGPVDAWLASARAVMADHANEIQAAGDQEAQANRFAELNVRDQLVKLARTDLIQEAFGSGQELQLHGWVYDIRDGLIKTLMEIDTTTDLDGVGPPGRVL